MDDHPAEKDFDSIRNKRPAHYDHKKVSGSDYMVGGATGFNLQEGTVGGNDRVTVKPYERNYPSAPKEAPLSPPDISMMNETPAPRVEGGVDMQVPPYRKY